MALVALGFLIPIGELHAQFHDQGLQYAKIRTDYNATNEGTAANPITLVTPCLYASAPCNTTPTIFSQSNYFQQNGGGSSSTFWVLSMNNEPWYGWPPNNYPISPGPPNQSLPRAFPGSGVMGFAAIIDYAAGENFWRLHKVLNHAFPNPLGTDAIPFLAIGAFENRGNGGQIGTFNVPGEPHVVAFTDKLWDYNQGTSDWLVSHVLIASAEWGGKVRMLFIHLFYDGVLGGSSWNGWSEIDDTGSGSTGGGDGWNWQMQESFWYPGANTIFMDAAAMSLPQVCNLNIPQFQYIGQQINYVIDLEEAFRCASNEGHFESPMPLATPVPLTGVYWYVELYGAASGIWTSVHNMRMVQPLPFSCSQAESCLSVAKVGMQKPPAAVLPNGIDAYLSRHGTVADIRENIEASCAAVPGCSEVNTWSVPGAPVPERSGDGVTGTIHELVEMNRSRSGAGG